MYDSWIMSVRKAIVFQCNSYNLNGIVLQRSKYLKKCSCIKATLSDLLHSVKTVHPKTTQDFGSLMSWHLRNIN